MNDTTSTSTTDTSNLSRMNRMATERKREALASARAAAERGDYNRVVTALYAAREASEVEAFTEQLLGQVAS